MKRLILTVLALGIALPSVAASDYFSKVLLVRSTANDLKTPIDIVTPASGNIFAQSDINTIFIDSRFIDTLNHEQLRFVLLHEYYHILFKHVVASGVARTRQVSEREEEIMHKQHEYEADSLATTTMKLSGVSKEDTCSVFDLLPDVDSDTHPRSSDRKKNCEDIYDIIETPKLHS